MVSALAKVKYTETDQISKIKEKSRQVLHVYAYAPPSHFFFLACGDPTFVAIAASGMIQLLSRSFICSARLFLSLSLTDEKIEFLRASGYSTETRSLTFSSLEGLCG